MLLGTEKKEAKKRKKEKRKKRRGVKAIFTRLGSFLATNKCHQGSHTKTFHLFLAMNDSYPDMKKQTGRKKLGKNFGAYFLFPVLF